MTNLVNNLIAKGYLKSERIIRAFQVVTRKDFVPAHLKAESEVNAPLPIGYGQTISQPLTVAFMLELLQPQKGDRVLDVGSGSGWQSCLLAHIVGDHGKVVAIERIPELSEFGKNNASKYRYENLKFVVGDGSMGFKEEAPFDKIIVAASAFRHVPHELKNQLKIGGSLVIPVDQSVWLVEKKSENEFEEKEYPGFMFVPLISDKGSFENNE